MRICVQIHRFSLRFRGTWFIRKLYCRLFLDAKKLSTWSAELILTTELADLVSFFVWSNYGQNGIRSKYVESRSPRFYSFNVIRLIHHYFSEFYFSRPKYVTRHFSRDLYRHKGFSLTKKTVFRTYIFVFDVGTGEGREARDIDC